MSLLPEISKGNTRVDIPACLYVFFLRSVANRSQVLNTHDSLTLTDARNGVMAEEEKILM